MAHYNLWTDPFLFVERLDGSRARLGLGEILRNAHALRAITDSSPLGVGGALRFLIALATATQPVSDERAARELWNRGRFSLITLRAFAERYQKRFDLFSANQPFLQSADLTLDGADLNVPERQRKNKPKKKKRHEAEADEPPRAPQDSIARLFDELPSGAYSAFWRHLHEDDAVVCPACAGIGLVALPAFARGKGVGFRVGPTGVPPILVFPEGPTLFHSLAASILPSARYSDAHAERDTPWWEHGENVREEAHATLGVLQALTLPVRRLRLYPDEQAARCVRCGAAMDVGVRRVSFQSGEYLDHTLFWRDPFGAYRSNAAPVNPSKKSKHPAKPQANKSVTALYTPLRPQVGRAFWREYAALFLPTQDAAAFQRPQVVEWIRRAELPVARFRLLGVATDLRAKDHDWLDANVSVPVALEQAEPAARVRVGLELARRIDAFARFIAEPAQRGAASCAGSPAYWQRLEPHFRAFVGASASVAATCALVAAVRESAQAAWPYQAKAIATRVQRQSVEQFPDFAAQGPVP